MLLVCVLRFEDKVGTLASVTSMMLNKCMSESLPSWVQLLCEVA
jgi:hypothetical protein